MNSLDVANYIKDRCDNELQGAMSFIENELGIDIKYTDQPFNSFYTKYKITYNNKTLNQSFFYNQARDFVLEIWKYLDDEQKQKLIEICKINSSHIKEDKSSTDINSTDINENIINISTLGELYNQISKSTNIENKQDIQDIISQLEDAKDNGDKDSYFYLFFDILDKLHCSELVPKWISKSAKFAKKFINKKNI